MVFIFGQQLGQKLRTGNRKETCRHETLGLFLQGDGTGMQNSGTGLSGSASLKGLPSFQALLRKVGKVLVWSYRRGDGAGSSSASLAASGVQQFQPHSFTDFYKVALLHHVQGQLY